LSCGRKSSQPHDGGPGGTFECPTAPEDTAGKIRDEAFLQQQPDAEYPVAVWLKAEANTAPCVGSTDGGTRCSDEAIEDRVRANGSQVQCVVNWLRGDSGHGPSLVPIWYEAPDIESTGRPAPIGAAFTTTLSVPQIKSLADNAFVEAIEPAPGSAAGVAVTALVEPADCPASVDAPDAKLSDATTIQGQGRQAVVVDFRDDGVF